MATQSLKYTKEQRDFIRATAIAVDELVAVMQASLDEIDFERGEYYMKKKQTKKRASKKTASKKKKK